MIIKLSAIVVLPEVQERWLATSYRLDSELEECSEEYGYVDADRLYVCVAKPDGDCITLAVAEPGEWLWTWCLLPRAEA